MVWSHFDKDTFVTHTDLFIGARVAIVRINFLPEVNLYNRVIGMVDKIV